MHSFLRCENSRLVIGGFALREKGVVSRSEPAEHFRTPCSHHWFSSQWLLSGVLKMATPKSLEFPLLFLPLRGSEVALRRSAERRGGDVILIVIRANGQRLKVKGAKIPNLCLNCFNVIS